MEQTGRYSQERMIIHKKQGPATFLIKGGQPQEGAVSPRIFGNFLEHLSFSTQGGILAQLLDNPALTMDDNLDPETRRHLVENGRVLEQIAHMDPALAKQQYGNWLPTSRATGFSSALLDDMREEGIPFPWKAEPAVFAQGNRKGRVGPSVQLSPRDGSVILSQGIFAPHHRVLAYEGTVWARSNQDLTFCARFARRCGEVLATAPLDNPKGRWTKQEFRLELPAGVLKKGEPVDFQLVAEGCGELLIDRATLLPTDHVEGFDPELLELTKEYAPPILRGPGGNFVSGYHFWHGIGDLDYRQTFKNPAWPGIETNFFGPDEFLKLCELIGSEPHITINLGDGVPEEAAAWVEYVNGPADSHWGAKRAANGHPEPYNVRLWEVGNEIYGEWQVGNCGDIENARRYRETAAAMRAVDPTIELIGNGTEFDCYDEHMTWNQVLMEEGGETLECISLHALPGNEQHEPDQGAGEVWLALQAQPARWEREDMPRFLDCAAEVMPGRKLTFAITEWGILGQGKFLPSCHNSGDSVWGASFYNTCLRMNEHIKVTNATALYHGGCLEKVGPYQYVDPQLEVIKRYTRLAGGTLYPMEYTGPVYQVGRGIFPVPATPDVPVLDATCVKATDGSVVVAIVNRHHCEDHPVTINLEGFGGLKLKGCEIQQGETMADMNTPLDPNHVPFVPHKADLAGNQLTVEAPARSVIFATLQ